MNKASYYQKAQEGLLRKGEQNNPDFVQELVNSGEAFTDLDKVRKFYNTVVCCILCLLDLNSHPYGLSLHRRSCLSLSIYSPCCHSCSVQSDRPTEQKTLRCV